MGRCSSPRSEPVKGYTRAAPGKKRRRPTKAAAAPAGPYYTCVNERSGRTCGTKHKSRFAAVEHRKRLDLASYRAGQGRPWNVEKR